MYPTRKLSTAARKKNLMYGLSALMTTTMVNMKDIITIARKHGIKTDFLIGGAVVTDGLREIIGASFAQRRRRSVKVVENLIKKVIICIMKFHKRFKKKNTPITAASFFPSGSLWPRDFSIILFVKLIPVSSPDSMDKTGLDFF